MRHGEGTKSTAGALKQFLKKLPADMPVQIRLFEGDWAARHTAEVSVEGGVVVIDPGKEVEHE